jgi:hypothetical protein
MITPEVVSFIRWCRDNGVEACEVGAVKVRFGPPVAPPLSAVTPPPTGAGPDHESVDDETLATWSSGK